MNRRSQVIVGLLLGASLVIGFDFGQSWKDKQETKVLPVRDVDKEFDDFTKRIEQGGALLQQHALVVGPGISAKDVDPFDAAFVLVVPSRFRGMPDGAYSVETGRKPGTLDFTRFAARGENRP